MGAIARFVMQGPYQAVLLAVLFAAIPLMYWVSAAIVALVILRQGLNKGLNVLLPALLPGIVWYALQQEITVFMVVSFSHQAIVIIVNMTHADYGKFLTTTARGLLN